MKHRHNKKLTAFLSALALITLGACSGTSDSPDDDATIIGTGISLEGTATSNKLFASNTVEVRARSGERSTGTIDTMGRYAIDSAPGTGPWLIRTDLGNNEYLYGIAANVSADEQVQNIHSYSDTVVRSWYTSQNMDVDSIFQSSDTNASMPSDAQVTAIYNILTNVVTDVIDNYGITGVNLNTAQFVANNSDVDSFIKQNPVIRNDDSISIIVFDPLNNATAVAVDNFALANDLTDTDTTSPSAPNALRALPSATDEITLVWDVATDNIGITRYSISRNGQEIATSPYPVFIDGGLTPGMNNSYNVVAIDAAGNRSAPTTTVSASPLASVDTIAPPAPASVTIDTRRGSLDLEWSLSDVSDVASFVIQRGTGPTALSEYTNVTSTYFFDEAVNAGIQYCYTISAMDASGNASAEVGPTCAVVPGTVVSGSDTTPVITTPTTDGLTAPQVDVSDLTCTTAFPVTSVRVDTVVPAGCYIAESSISVSEPANLTLEPGVVVKFFTGVRFEVLNGASITALGTAADPIVLSGFEATPGHWTGLWINSSSTRNALDYVQIEYAGNSALNWGGLHFGSLGFDKRINLTNSTMRFNQGPGMTVRVNMPLSTFDGNRYTENESPVYILDNQAFMLDKRSLYTGNTLDAVLLNGDTPRYTDISVPALAVPYHVDGNIRMLDGNLMIEPGTTMKFAETGYIFLDSDDNQIAGTADAPITLAGIDGVAGSWEGISMNSVSDTVFRHLNIQHAGGDDEISAIRMRGSVRTVFDNVSITETEGVGISAGTDARIAEFTNNTITGNEGIANVSLYVAQAFNNAGNFLGNTSDTVEVSTGLAFEDDVALTNSQVRYEVEQIHVRGNTLTIGEGVSLFMREDSQFLVAANASMVSNGTAAQPVSIVGLEPTPGFWDGIDFSVAAGNENRLSHTLVSDGGGEFDASAGNLKLACSVDSQITIDNSQFDNSAGYGIFVGANNCTVNIDEATTFMGNALGNMN